MSKAAKPGSDLAHDILGPRPRPLAAFFAPETVAVIGATDRPASVGRTVLWNLISNAFGRTVFPVHPRRPGVLGIKAYPHIAAVPAAVDLAVIVTPAATVPGIIGECVDAKVEAAIIISAGFKEAGAAGVELERQIEQQLRRGTMRVLGPNSVGVMCPSSGLNVAPAAMARPGKVGFLSQSGALLAAILDWSLQANVGFSAFVSLGSMLDVGWGDLIDYLGDDPHTHSILVYMESIGDARSFLSAAREVALRKPVIVLKAGRTEAAARAAASHTGALTGSDAVLDAAFRRTGVLRVNTIDELFSMGEVLGKQPRPRGPRLTILTNAGGPGVLATDALIARGGELTPLSPPTVQALDQLLPSHWSHQNPIDILDDASPERYARAVGIAAKDPNSDGLLVILTPQSVTDPTQTAEQLKGYAHLAGTPLLASWMGGAGVAAGVSILNRADIPTFPNPEVAARVFHYMYCYTYNLRGLYETPVLPREGLGQGYSSAEADGIVQAARQAGRTLLTEWESKQILAGYGIPTAPTFIAASEAEAVAQAGAVGYPVVLKLHSRTVTHKTDVGGVQLNLTDAASVRRAYRAIKTSVREMAGSQHFGGVTVQPMVRLDGYELILGSSVDPQFGPVLLFGTGGQLVEVFQDRALALPPLTTTLARRMMEQTRIFTALKGARGRKPVDLAALEQLLVRFSHLVVAQRWIREIDVNPLLATSEQFLALDARVLLHGPEVQEDRLPRPAIRPYPEHYTSPWTLKDGTAVTIRPIRPEDETLMVKFHETLSEQTVYQRYFQGLKLSQRVAHERLARLCFIDYDREMALVADREDSQTGSHDIIAIGRLIKMHGSDEAEAAVLVSDRYQRKGLGTEMVRRLLQIGRDEGLHRVILEILRENTGMQRVCEKLRGRLHRPLDDSPVRAIMTL